MGLGDRRSERNCYENSGGRVRENNKRGGDSDGLQV
jgi:hypothetical protein